MIEHGSLITGLPGWLALTMTYHRTEERGVYNKILQHDKHCPEEMHTTLQFAQIQGTRLWEWRVLHGLQSSSKVSDNKVGPPMFSVFWCGDSCIDS